jgi:hypothetical protein
MCPYWLRPHGLGFSRRYLPDRDAWTMSVWRPVVNSMSEAGTNRTRGSSPCVSRIPRPGSSVLWCMSSPITSSSPVRSTTSCVHLSWPRKGTLQTRHGSRGCPSMTKAREPGRPYLPNSGRRPSPSWSSVSGPRTRAWSSAPILPRWYVTGVGANRSSVGRAELVRHASGAVSGFPLLPATGPRSSSCAASSRAARSSGGAD